MCTCRPKLLLSGGKVLLNQQHAPRGPVVNLPRLRQTTDSKRGSIQQPAPGNVNYNTAKLRRLDSSQPCLLHLPSGVIVVRVQGGRGLAAAGPRHLEAAVPVPELDVLLLGGGSRVQVDDKREDVGGEDEGDDPLEDGGGVVVACGHAGGEGDGEHDLDDDEGKLDPEGNAEDAVLAVAFLTPC